MITSALCLCLFLGVVVVARRHSPLLAEEGGVGRKGSRAAECQFGKQLRELGSTWFADLGPPFGVMYCIKCECVPYQKKRRVVGKVHCRNIKHECPKPSCDEPVLGPGRCCKVCPADADSPDVVQDVAPVISFEEEEKNFKHYAALLTGRTTRTEGVDGEAVRGQEGRPTATGRFSFHRRALYYSFYATARPSGVQFLDTKGNILEEQVVAPSSAYQNATGKVCGVWKRIPREYRKLIREEKLVTTLLWDRPELAISGQLCRFRSLVTEQYSALMEGGTPGSGGTAIVSINSAAPSLHLTLLFNGLFLPTEMSDTPLTLRLQAHDKQNSILEEVVRVEKPSSELNMVEVRSAVSLADLRSLSRSRLVLSLSSRSTPLTLSGPVLPRVTCELFQALLAPPSHTHVTSPADLDPPTTTAAGLAWMFIDREGSLRYNVHTRDVANPVVIGLVVERRLIELEDLTPSLHAGWANGSLDRLAPKHLDQLYNHELAVNIATTAADSLVRGRLVTRPVAEARDSDGPMLLEGAARLTGMVWAAVDVECNLHYEVVLAGPGVETQDFEVVLEEVPVLAPGAPVGRRVLENFTGPQVEGSALGLSTAELARLDAGVVHFDIVSAGLSQLRARWNHINVPPSCLPHYSDNDVPPVNYNSDSGAPEAAPLCYHGERFHEEGAQWSSASQPCTMCHCHHGRVKCDPVLCPQITCGQPTLRPSHCCPTCDNSTSESTTRSCFLAGQTYAPGATWHPYLPPNGFDTCAVCTCNSETLSIECPHVDCPSLTCDERVAVRPDRKACCKVCPSSLPHHLASPLPHLLSGMAGDAEEHEGPTEAEVLAGGGCRYPVGGPYENGHEWHPRLYSHGEVKCVKCRCKDGKVSCDRKRCKRSSCNDECCSAHCEQRKRHNH